MKTNGKRKKEKKLQLIKSRWRKPSEWRWDLRMWSVGVKSHWDEVLVSITHNSKIRELSDENRVMETELSFAKQPFCYGSHHFWVMSYGNWELSYGNCESKQPLKGQFCIFAYNLSILYELACNSKQTHGCI